MGVNLQGASLWGLSEYQGVNLEGANLQGVTCANFQSKVTSNLLNYLTESVRQSLLYSIDLLNSRLEQPSDLDGTFGCIKNGAFSELTEEQILETMKKLKDENVPEAIQTRIEERLEERKGRKGNWEESIRGVLTKEDGCKIIAELKTLYRNLGYHDNKQDSEEEKEIEKEILQDRCG